MEKSIFKNFLIQTFFSRKIFYQSHYSFNGRLMNVAIEQRPSIIKSAFSVIISSSANPTTGNHFNHFIYLRDRTLSTPISQRVASFLFPNLTEALDIRSSRRKRAGNTNVFSQKTKVGSTIWSSVGFAFRSIKHPAGTRPPRSPQAEDHWIVGLTRLSKGATDCKTCPMIF